MMNKQRLLEESESLANFIIDCVGKNKLLVGHVDLLKRRAFGKELVSDLGDYVPFFYWLGKLTNKKEYSHWAEKQIRLAVKYQMPCGLFYTNGFKVLPFNDLGDTILGINLMYELTNKKFYKDLAIKFFNGLFSFVRSDGFIYSHGISYPGYCGLFIEELSRLYQFSMDKKYLYMAKRMAKSWINNKFFEKYSLFPFRFLGFTLPIVKVMKGNTNLMFGLLTLYEFNKNLFVSIDKWIESALNKLLSPSDVFYSLWIVNKGFNSTLEANHAVIDVLLESFQLFKDESLLKPISNCADSWINKKNTLIPENIESHSLSRLDSQVDFAVVLLKLYEITKKRKYYDIAFEIIGGIIKYHKFDNGYAEFVNIETKEKTGLVIETKFLSLLIKLFLTAYEVLGKNRIYSDKLLRDLVRDR